MKLTPQDVRSAYRRLFASSDGKIVLEDLLAAHCGPGYRDGWGELKLAYQAGKRDLVIEDIGSKLKKPVRQIRVESLAEED